MSEESSPRYIVAKASGSRYAYVIDTLRGGTVKRYDVLIGDGWNYATAHAKALNEKDAAPTAQDRGNGT